MICPSIIFQLLPRLHDIANQSQNTGSPIEEKLKEISIELKSVLEEQIQARHNWNSIVRALN